MACAACPAGVSATAQHPRQTRPSPVWICGALRCCWNPREEVHMTRPPDHREGPGHVMAGDGLMAWYRKKIPKCNEFNYLESAFCNCNIHIVELTVLISWEYLHIGHRRVEWPTSDFIPDHNSDTNIIHFFQKSDTKSNTFNQRCVSQIDILNLYCIACRFQTVSDNNNPSDSATVSRKPIITSDCSLQLQQGGDSVRDSPTLRWARTNENQWTKGKKEKLVLTLVKCPQSVCCERLSHS